MDGTTIRLAQGDDFDWAARLMATSDPWVTLGRGYHTCLAACTVPTDTLEIAASGGTRRGFVLVRPHGVAGAPYIVSIAVDQAFRSHGVGAALLAHVEAAYRGRAAHLFLCVSSFNTGARTFYQRLGFDEVGRFKDFIIAGADELLMYKRLDRPASTRPPQ